MRVRVGDHVEGDVDAALIPRPPRRGVDGLLVERVDHGGLRPSARRADVVGDRRERGLGAAGQVDGRALAGECPGNRAADRSATAVDHRVLVLEQHVYLLNSDLRA